MMGTILVKSLAVLFAFVFDGEADSSNDHYEIEDVYDDDIDYMFAPKPPSFTVASISPAGLFTEAAFARLKAKTTGSAIAFVMLIPHDCETLPVCSVFPQFWTRIVDENPGYAYFSPCGATQEEGKNCGPEVTFPTVMEWTPSGFESYQGPKNFDALSEYVKHRIVGSGVPSHAKIQKKTPTDSDFDYYDLGAPPRSSSAGELSSMTMREMFDLPVDEDLTKAAKTTDKKSATPANAPRKEASEFDYYDLSSTAQKDDDLEASIKTMKDMFAMPEEGQEKKDVKTKSKRTQKREKSKKPSRPAATDFDYYDLGGSSDKITDLEAGIKSMREMFAMPPEGQESAKTKDKKKKKRTEKQKKTSPTKAPDFEDYDDEQGPPTKVKPFFHVSKIRKENIMAQTDVAKLKPDSVCFVMLIPHTCPFDHTCAKFPQFWSDVVAEFPARAFFSPCGGSAAEGKNCGPEVTFPAVVEWTNSRFEPYNGGRSFIELYAYVKKKMALNGAPKQTGQLDNTQKDEYYADDYYDESFVDFSKRRDEPSGTFKQIPIADVASLAHEDFVRKYVRSSTPVLLRRRSSAATSVDAQWLLEHCEADRLQQGTIRAYRSAGKSEGWAGFKSGSKVPLRIFLDRVMSNPSTVEYGRDYRLACNCPKFLDQVPQLRYFQGDVIQVNAKLPRRTWPMLSVGPETSRSGLHVDRYVFPFWVTVVKGKKLVRVITFEDWKEHLIPAGFYDKSGAVTMPVNAFDDKTVVQRLLSTGVHVWNATLDVGDTLYVPTGALYGSENLHTPTIAYSARFLDREHSQQVLEGACHGDVNKMEKASRRVCKWLQWATSPSKEGDVPEGSFADITRRLQAWTDESQSSSGKNEYSYWAWLLKQGGFCANRTGTECPGVVERCTDPDSLLHSDEL